MKKQSIGLILVTLVLLLCVWAGVGVSASPEADAWLGIWDTKVKIPGCPGPEPDGSWRGAFEVSREGDRYSFRWLNVDYAVDLLAISGSEIKNRIHNLWGSEFTFTMTGKGQATYTEVQKYELNRDPPNPCAGSSGVATKRAAITPAEEKVTGTIEDLEAQIEELDKELEKLRSDKENLTKEYFDLHDKHKDVVAEEYDLAMDYISDLQDEYRNWITVLPKLAEAWQRVLGSETFIDRLKRKVEKYKRTLEKRQQIEKRLGETLGRSKEIRSEIGKKRKKREKIKLEIEKIELTQPL